MDEGGETFFPRALNEEGREYNPWNGDHEAPRNLDLASTPHTSHTLRTHFARTSRAHHLPLACPSPRLPLACPSPLFAPLLSCPSRSHLGA